MSFPSTVGYKVIPPSDLAYNLPNSGVPWTKGSWVTYIASASAPVTIIGISIRSNNGYASMQCEIVVGADEVEVGSIRLYGPNSGVGGPGAFFLPAPIGPFATGTKISLAQRDAGGALNIQVCLMYAENYTSDNQTLVPITSLPAQANQVTITANATGWANSAWKEITSGVGHEVSLIGVVCSHSSASCFTEFDIGIGDIGAETVITTFRMSTQAASTGFLWFALLPAMLPIAANARICARMRQSVSSGDNQSIALIVYDDTFVPTPSSGGNRLSGLYKFVVDKHDDTFYEDLTTEATNDYLIPDAFAKTAYIGDE